MRLFGRSSEVMPSPPTGEVETLIDALDDDDEERRRGAAETLGRTRDPRALAPLLRLLRSPDQARRAAAVAGLGELGDPGAVGPLLELFTGSVEGMRAALRAVHDRPDDPELEMIAAPQAQIGQLTIAVADALAALGDPSTVAAFRAVVGDELFAPGWEVSESLLFPRLLRAQAVALHERSVEALARLA